MSKHKHDGIDFRLIKRCQQMLDDRLAGERQCEFRPPHTTTESGSGNDGENRHVQNQSAEFGILDDAAAVGGNIAGLWQGNAMTTRANADTCGLSGFGPVRI